MNKLDLLRQSVNTKYVLITAFGVKLTTSNLVFE